MCCRLADGSVFRPYLVYVQYQAWAYKNKMPMYKGYQLDLECGGHQFFPWVAGSFSAVSNDMLDFCDCIQAPEAVRKTAGLQLLCNTNEAKMGYCQQEAAGANITAGSLDNRIANLDICNKFWGPSNPPLSPPPPGPPTPTAPTSAPTIASMEVILVNNISDTIVVKQVIKSAGKVLCKLAPKANCTVTSNFVATVQDAWDTEGDIFSDFVGTSTWNTMHKTYAIQRSAKDQHWLDYIQI